MDRLAPSAGADPQPKRVGRLVMPALVALLCAICFAEAALLFPERLCDFRAFYCSGRAVLAGADPYRLHPLHECEHRLPGPFVSALEPDVTIPAPYPGFVLAGFAVVARLPFDAAVVVWTLASVAALGAAIVMIARVTALPRAATAIVLGLPAAIIPLPLGQPTLFVLVALAACAAFLRAGAARAAALAATATLVDPHAGLAVCLAVACGVPRARLTLLAAVGALAIFDLVVFGPAREREYLRDVLPLHALVNVPEFSQFSTANLLFASGVPAAIALRIGTCWYAVSLLVGVVAGLRLRARLGPAAVAWVPIAFAVYGGGHTHLQQLALALPALLLLTSAARGRSRTVLVVVTFVAAVPWLIASALLPLFLAIPVLGAVWARAMRESRLAAPLSAGSLLVLSGICCAIAYEHVPHAPYVGFAHDAGGNPLAEVAWGRFIAASSLPVRAWYTLGKLPTLIALGVALLVLVRAAIAPHARGVAGSPHAEALSGRYAS